MPLELGLPPLLLVEEALFYYCWLFDLFPLFNRPCLDEVLVGCYPLLAGFVEAPFETAILLP